MGRWEWQHHVGSSIVERSSLCFCHCETALWRLERSLRNATWIRRRCSWLQPCCCLLGKTKLNKGFFKQHHQQWKYQHPKPYHELGIRKGIQNGNQKLSLLRIPTTGSGAWVQPVKPKFGLFRLYHLIDQPKLKVLQKIKKKQKNIKKTENKTKKIIIISEFYQQPNSISKISPFILSFFKRIIPFLLFLCTLILYYN